MTELPRMAPSARDRYLGLAPTIREGFPVIDDPGDPCWSLAVANWPGLTAVEAFEIVTKTRPSKGDTA